MKVLESKHKDFKLEVSCKNCESRLELEKDDIYYGDFYSGMDAEMSMDFYVICPVCGEYVFIDEKKLPRHVQFAAEQRGKKKKPSKTGKKTEE